MVAVAKRLGAEYFEENTGHDKTNFDFDFETDDDTPFTVYDWKHYRPLNLEETVEWHIGGKNAYDCRKAKEELQQMLKSI